jgi:hypothetical protein
MSASSFLRLSARPLRITTLSDGMVLKNSRPQVNSRVLRGATTSMRRTNPLRLSQSKAQIADLVLPVPMELSTNERRFIVIDTAVWICLANARFPSIEGKS